MEDLMLVDEFAAAAAILACTPAMAHGQVFTITGTRIPGEARDVVSAKTFVQDGITIITGTRIPTAVAAAVTPVQTPTTLETRVVVRQESTSAPADTASAPVESTSAPSEPESSAPAQETTSAPGPVKARASAVFVEKRCLALGAECGNNGVYTDCCDDQLCAENHGTGSLTCGGVSVKARDVAEDAAPANETLVESVLEKRCLALGSECGDNGVYTDCCDNQLCAENHGTGSLTCGGVSVKARDVAEDTAPANETLVESVLEKRCLALGSECGDNGVYTDCCDNQLCAENHGTGSLTCGGVSV
ncbi:hypothetical protein HDK90DRAFT_102254 [Phyllosticta capitalensis]|uniref:Uncharacterized protein n=1 Tax=Phyllosticta capitalensis TaxID=121624 RepID=A0ABR1YB32_9PEZI